MTIGRRPSARISGSANSVRVAGGFAYSPNVSNTGAWSWYAAAGLGYDVPSGLLPQDIGVSFTGGAGYSWFGNQSQELGGFPLPAYLNWQAGVTFTRKIFSLDLRYYDTNLSKENCFVFTGDPNARPGGSIDPVTNPEGLTSRWCSATFVAKVSFAFELATRRPHHRSSGHLPLKYTISMPRGRCPLWVKGGHVQCTRRCPLCANRGHSPIDVSFMFRRRGYPQRPIVRAMTSMQGGLSPVR